MARLTVSTCKNLQRTLTQPYASSPLIQICRAIPIPLQPRITYPSCRSASKYRKVERSALRGQLPEEVEKTLDQNIASLRCRVVDGNNKLGGPELLRDLITSIEGTGQHVRKVSNGSEEGIPIVKVVTRESLLQAAKVKELLSAKKDVSELAKQLELNWAIDGNDLNHRLRKIEEFLRKGYRVEIMIAPKRKGRRAEVEEVMNLLDMIKQTVASVEGATEWKPTEGLPGKIMEMSFAGPDAVVKSRAMERVEAKSEKRSKKDEERDARRLKEEARLAQKRKEMEELEQESKIMAQQLKADAKARLKQR